MTDIIKILKHRESNARWSKTERGKKTIKIKTWRNRGVLPTPSGESFKSYDDIYKIYMSTEFCNYCEKKFYDSFDKCLDHNHDNGGVRGVICRSCNVKDVYQDAPEGVPGLSEADLFLIDCLTN
tara:strand:+ start:1004 stop:1375 length:372 start_codon:yes stop_codon:yes gene_type:complete